MGNAAPDLGETTHHATCVRLGAAGVLIRGASGAGKSSLALRLIDRGALLVADDRVCLEPTTEGLQASPPARLAGLLEVRGLGVCRLPPLATVASARVVLVVDLVGPGQAERCPVRSEVVLCGRSLAHLCLESGDPAAPEKVRIALAALCDRSVELIMELK